MLKHYQNLTDLYPFDQHSMISLIGGGGKTTLLFALGEELSATSSLVLSTTTHMRYPQHLNPKQIVLQDDPEQMSNVLHQYHLCYIASTDTKNPDKVTKPSDHMARAMAKTADYVIYEADGSRGLPIKCMASHEPAVPKTTSLTIQVIGATCLHHPAQEVLHRYEIAQERLGISPQEPIHTKQLITLALDNFRHCPTTAKLFIINQIDVGISSQECHDIKTALSPIPVLFLSLQDKTYL